MVALLIVTEGGIDWVRFCEAAVAASIERMIFDMVPIIAASLWKGAGGEMEGLQRESESTYWCLRPSQLTYVNSNQQRGV